MLLVHELSACECPDSPEKFKERLIDTIQEDFPGLTIDDLVCEPDRALAYCERIRDEAEAPNLHDPVILKTLMNIRRNKLCPRELKIKRHRINLDRALREHDCDLSPKEFREDLVDAFASMYKSRTIDELLCHPREARAFCNYSRSRLGCVELPNSLILRTLMNVRKAGNQ